MALYEYYCNACRKRFEQINKYEERDAGKCPKCEGIDVRRMVPLFRVGGRGDLRESTMHGCHSCQVGLPHEHGGGGSGGAYDSSDEETALKKVWAGQDDSHNPSGKPSDSED